MNHNTLDIKTLGPFEIRHKNWVLVADSGKLESKKDTLTATKIRAKQIMKQTTAPNINFQAEKMVLNLKNDQATFYKNIVFHWENTRLESQQQILFFKENRIQFIGPTELFNKKDHLSSSQITLNLKSQQLIIKEAKLKVTL